MADQQLLDVFDGEDEEERLWEALSSFKEMVRGLVEKTGLSTNVLADMHNFGKGKVATWQNPKREGPNIPPLRFVEVLIKEAQERANLQDGAAAVFLHQYGELLKLYCARANPHNVHRQMLADYQKTLLIRELNNATNAALEQIAALTGELQTLREDRDGERRNRIALQQRINSLGSQNQDRAAEKKAALAQRDQIRADLRAYERDQQLEKWKHGAEQGGSHTNQPHEPVVPLPPLPGRGAKRRGLALALVAVGAVVVSLAVYAGTQLSGDRNDHKDTTSSGPGTPPTASTDGPASPSRPPGDTTSAGTSAAPPVAGGGPAHGGNSSSGGADGSSSSNDNTGGSSGGASGGKTTGGLGDAGGSGGSGGTSGVTSPKPPAPSGNFRLRDVGYGQCLTSSNLNVVFATCTDSPVANWTAKAGSGGSYMLHNESAGQCLTANVNVLYLAECGSRTGQNWRTGTSSTIVNLYISLCLDESSGWPVLASCEPSRLTQHWARE